MFPHHTKIIGAFLILTALGLSACASLSPSGPTFTPAPTLTPAPPTNTPEPLALSVNNDGIPVTEFDAEVARYTAAQQALGKTVASMDATKAVIEDLTSQLLLAQGARAAGFVLDEAALQSRIDALASQVGGPENLSKWQADHGYNDAEFRSALRREAEAAWMRDKIVAGVPSTVEQVHVQQILLYNQDKAESFLQQLNGGADFDELAANADPLTRGDLGWVPRGYLLDKKIEDSAFSLPVGGHSDVIATDVGYHIVKVLEKDPNRALSPDAYLASQELALKNWIAQQRQQANIVLVPN